MTPQKFIDVFDTIAEAPGGIERLRELVLHLAVRGKLVPRDAEDEPASELFAGLEEGKKRLLEEGMISKSRYPSGIPVEKEPFKIPESWQWLHLGDVGAIVGGGTPRSGESSFWSDGQDVPWLTPADMSRQSSRYVSRGQRDITSEGLSRSSAQMLPTGSVLFSSRAPIGHVGIAANSLSTNQGFKSCVPFLPAMSEYLYIYLKHAGPGINDRASGTTFKEVAGREFALVPVSVPPLTEQLRIVAKVDVLMGMIDELETTRLSREDLRTAARDSTLAKLRNASTFQDVRASWSRIADRTDELFTDSADLASLRETILHLAVQGRLVPQDEGDEPVNPFLDRIANCKTNHIQAGNNGKHPRIPEPDESITVKELPNGWAWARTVDIGVLNPRNKADDDTMVSFCPMSSIPTDHRNRVTFETRRWGDIRKGYTHFADGDIVVAKITPCFQNRKSYVMSELEGGIGAGTTELYVVRVKPKIVLPEYLLLFYKSPGFLQDGVAAMTGTAGQQRVPRVYIERTPLPIPPLAEQHRIIAKVDELMELIDRLENHVVTKNRYQETAAAAAVHPV